MPPSLLLVRGDRRQELEDAKNSVEEPPGESDSPYHCIPHSLREIHSTSLLLSLASSDTERKQILDSFGMTIEEFGELFDHSRGFPGADD
ncbi:hypothetical protein [Streptomyces sp. NPDC047028]|uniref:hypothetical protein n=1 Tax=Streptomyces sp. NPDC047028 TaxID=3155793 RepID=UPI0033C323CC